MNMREKKNSSVDFKTLDRRIKKLHVKITALYSEINTV